VRLRDSKPPPVPPEPESKRNLDVAQQWREEPPLPQRGF
jgi:hypothetical protein